MKPILFSTDMVRAILDGRKTQTRRVLKPQPKGTPHYNSLRYHWYDPYLGTVNPELQFLNDVIPMPRQPFRAGDILWVRETWLEAEGSYHYLADTTSEIQRCLTDDGHRWKPSIHMPFEAARLLLGVTDVRAERLSDISLEDIKAEGIIDPEKLSFPDLWSSTIKPKDREKYGWSANPWVWVYTFEKISKEEAQRRNGN
ncbi:hypothetical protein FACS1894202_03680 [Clostridia bacterium]|nr:hypothetical protein FACS1894202_03680 [Clostridia bacterium]